MAFCETRQIVVFDDDADIADYAKEAIARFVRANIIGGKPGNLFDPKAGATRAEFASVLMRFVEAAGQVAPVVEQKKEKEADQEESTLEQEE